MEPAATVRGGRARAYAAALEAFRRLPLILRRLVVRMSTPNYTLGAVGVCVDDEGRVLLVRSRHHAGWSLPGGLVQRGEQPADGLARELREEVGVDVDLSAHVQPPPDQEPDSLGRLVTRTYVDTAIQVVTVVFAVDLPTPVRPDGVEILEATWFHPADLPPTLVRGTRDTLALMGVALDQTT